ncbi:hypothetical protein A3I48_00410 [Candidatus Daviesbacteria bacterium RIFCSPLOWO2_02_FULL_36_7]|uniref:Uncharacterized protein n=1 Tax=Candidatus Daviesbacteria bacterium RIFCSPLOWO2_02_FULL_36_7 TaxID=1797792 RepID=A0A1F5MHA2_9BACT|nr:MAG: hypothetical protein A3I48_00410 [Candidatus Daviesbacteria bacterium RIFCSPLOWO2_02_FULL_36_7]
MSNNESLIEFNPKLPKLSKNESQVLKLLVEAGKLIAPIYQEQERQARVRIDKKEIDKAAQKDSAILSPYTVVEKVDGKIIATPYHIKYAKFLEPIAKKLEEAAKLTENKAFGKALKIQAKALLDGGYEKATAAWLKLEPYILDISIGPLHHYDDRLPSLKASYHAWVGVVEKEGTDRLYNYKNVTLSARRKALVPKERIEMDQDQIKAKVLDVVLLSGIMARTKFVGLNLPIDVDIVEKYGAQVTLFNQPNDLRLKEQILPTFNKIFSREFRESFSREDLRRGYLRATALHELAHSYLYYKNAAKNLQDLSHVIYELAATILGLRLAGSLLLKDRITSKQLESMIVAYVSRDFYLIDESKNSKFMTNYVLGGKIFINFMLESGALKQSGGLIMVNFTKIFVSLHDLSTILESLLAQGTRKDVESFIRRYTR